VERNKTRGGSTAHVSVAGYEFSARWGDGRTFVAFGSVSGKIRSQSDD
jgi:hypothetical protein